MANGLLGIMQQARLGWQARPVLDCPLQRERIGCTEARLFVFSTSQKMSERIRTPCYCHFLSCSLLASGCPPPCCAARFLRCSHISCLRFVSTIS